MAALAIESVSRNPPKTQPLQSNLVLGLQILHIPNPSVSKHDWLPIPLIFFDSPVDSILFLINRLILFVTISRSLGWLRPLLLWDLFLKPENSNMTGIIYRNIPVISIALVVPIRLNPIPLSTSAQALVLIGIGIVIYSTTITLIISATTDVAVHLHRHPLFIYRQFY